jgi:hypothetical protein
MIRRNTIFSECSLELVKVLLLEDSDVLLVLNVGTSGFKVAIMLYTRDAQKCCAACGCLCFVSGPRIETHKIIILTFIV